MRNIILVLVTITLFLGCNDKNDVQNSFQEKVETSPSLVCADDKKDMQSPIIEEQKTNIKATIDEKPKPKFYPKQEIKRVSCDDSIKASEELDFDIIKKGFENENTLLIVGGIQGDEPGGFMAASLIATHYDIKKGSVWIIPNLNFYSIIKRSRGPYGDMNRKFASLDPKDPEYETIQRIKKYITNDKVKLVVNLHDGSGFYRPKYEDTVHSPFKWGQCSIIDQSSLDVKYYGNLEEISTSVVKHVNSHLLKKEDMYHLHNTHTRQGDKEMEKTLTYYAINQGKAAFGNEASKELPTHQRVYYHLLALEKYMQVAGIKFERKFNLNEQVVKNILDNDISISFYNGRIKFPMGQMRDIIRYFPVKKDGTIDFVPSNPLVSIIREKNEYTIYYGNRRLSRLYADYIEHLDENAKVDFVVDEVKEQYTFGDTVKVQKEFLVHPLKDYRINVIGFTNKDNIETNVNISKNDLMKRFSIDKDGTKYRVEFYKNEKFAGMIVVDFES